MHVPAESFVGTAWTQFLHRREALGGGQRVPRSSRDAGFERTRGCWFLLRQQFGLCKIGLSNHKLAGKDSAFVDRDRFRGYIAVKHSGFMNVDGASGNYFSGHPSFYVDVRHSHASVTLHVGFSLNADIISDKASRDFSDEVNCG